MKRTITVALALLLAGSVSLWAQKKEANKDAKKMQRI